MEDITTILAASIPQPEDSAEDANGNNLPNRRYVGYERYLLLCRHLLFPEFRPAQSSSKWFGIDRGQVLWKRRKKNQGCYCQYALNDFAQLSMSKKYCVVFHLFVPPSASSYIRPLAKKFFCWQKVCVCKGLQWSNLEFRKRSITDGAPQSSVKPMKKPESLHKSGGYGHWTATPYVWGRTDRDIRIDWMNFKEHKWTGGYLESYFSFLRPLCPLGGSYSSVQNL